MYQKFTLKRFKCSFVSASALRLRFDAFWAAESANALKDFYRF
jgi:hypothetical protein